ncbi:hypothetical protein K466DRAFT_606447 [Polyporus arcularius HHB13444]|uniref:Uncharacterized protein n=1 Tax=Polyporus arcularius HHB13444 TaxID=1314778 RepID=A0A5C3NSR5_9APHY|nr:hypothetical protein K466DRAFT_606447 [Polyporus arcularius HHB13444]
MSTLASPPLSQIDANLSFILAPVAQAQQHIPQLKENIAPGTTETTPEAHGVPGQYTSSALPINSLGCPPFYSPLAATTSSQLTTSDCPPPATAPPTAATIVLKATCEGERCNSCQISRLCGHGRCKRCCLLLKTPCGFKSHDSERNRHHIPAPPSSNPFSLSRPAPAVPYDHDGSSGTSPAVVAPSQTPITVNTLSPRSYQAEMPASILRSWNARQAALNEKREAEEKRRELELRMKHAVVLDIWTKDGQPPESLTVQAIKTWPTFSHPGPGDVSRVVDAMMVETNEHVLFRLCGVTACPGLDRICTEYQRHKFGVTASFGSHKRALDDADDTERPGHVQCSSLAHSSPGRFLSLLPQWSLLSPTFGTTTLMSSQSPYMWSPLLNAPRTPTIDPALSMVSLPPPSSSCASSVSSAQASPSLTPATPYDALGLYSLSPSPGPRVPSPSNQSMLPWTDALYPPIPDLPGSFPSSSPHPGPSSPSPHPTPSLSPLPGWDASDAVLSIQDDALWDEGRVWTPSYADSKQKWPYRIYARNMVRAFDLIGPAKVRDNGIIKSRFKRVFPGVNIASLYPLHSETSPLHPPSPSPHPRVTIYIISPPLSLRPHVIVYLSTLVSLSDTHQFSPSTRHLVSLFTLSVAAPSLHWWCLLCSALLQIRVCLTPGKANYGRSFVTCHPFDKHGIAIHAVFFRFCNDRIDMMSDTPPPATAINSDAPPSLPPGTDGTAPLAAPTGLAAAAVPLQAPAAMVALPSTPVAAHAPAVAVAVSPLTPEWAALILDLYCRFGPKGSCACKVSQHCKHHCCATHCRALGRCRRVPSHRIASVSRLPPLAGPSKHRDDPPPIAGPSNLAHPVYRPGSAGHVITDDTDEVVDDFPEQLELAINASLEDMRRSRVAEETFDEQLALAVSASLEDMPTDPDPKAEPDTNLKHARSPSWDIIDEDEHPPKKITTEAYFDPHPIFWFCHTGQGCIDGHPPLSLCVPSRSSARASASDVAFDVTGPKQFDEPPIVVARERVANLRQQNLASEGHVSDSGSGTDSGSASSSSLGPSTPSTSSVDVGLLGLGLSEELQTASVPRTRKPRVHIEQVDIDLTVDNFDD